MRAKWFPHGKWPKLLVSLHYYTIISFVLLVVTGVALYLPAVHASLISILPFIYQLHILLGLVFAVSLLAPFLRLLPPGRSITRIDWWVPTLFGTAIVLTGVLLWGVSVFPTIWRAPAFTWHGWFTVVLGSWILIHAFLKAFGVRPPNRSWAGRVDPERRMFLRWFGAGVLGTAVFTVLDPVGVLRALFTSSGFQGQTTGASAGGFPETYTVIGSYPAMKLADYKLHVEGLVAQPLQLDFATLQKIPPSQETVNFQCVTGWSVPNVRWEGVHIADLVTQVQPHPTAQYVNFYSFDGVYTESLPLQEVLDKSVLLAYQLNGKPLPVDQGYPVRLVVPKMYGYKSIKWVARVEFSDKPLVGYWEQRGYPTQAYF